MTKAAHPLRLTIHAPAGVGPAAERLTAVVSGLDSQLRVGRPRSFGEIYGPHRFGDHTFGIMLSAAVVIVLLFSMAGIYTLTTFIVTQRRREIGVRSALGAPPRRLLAGIFGRAAVPLLIGAVAGCGVAIGLLSWLPIAEAGGVRIPGVVPGSAGLMIVIGLVAVAGPARRAIHIDPTEALRVI
jgi:ABC-type antimicrobial peptide transport system permease subunit